MAEEIMHGDYSLELKEEDPEFVRAKAMLLDNKLVAEWEHGGHIFQIYQIEPTRIGASVRNYQLWAGGVPASGGQWHETIEHARERAAFIAEGSMANKIRYLEGLLFQYRNQRRDDTLAMEIAIEYIEEAPEPKPHSRDVMVETLRGRIDGKLSWPTP